MSQRMIEVSIGDVIEVASYHGNYVITQTQPTFCGSPVEGWDTDEMKVKMSGTLEGPVTKIIGHIGLENLVEHITVGFELPDDADFASLVLEHLTEQDAYGPIEIPFADQL